MKPIELIKWRKKNGYSQIRLAKALGVITQTVFRWEKGKRAIPPFLHLALKCLELKRGELEKQGRRKKGSKKTI